MQRLQRSGLQRRRSAVGRHQDRPNGSLSPRKSSRNIRLVGVRRRHDLPGWRQCAEMKPPCGPASAVRSLDKARWPIRPGCATPAGGGLSIAPGVDYRSRVNMSRARWGQLSWFMAGRNMEFGAYTFVRPGTIRGRASRSMSTGASPTFWSRSSSPMASASTSSALASITGRTMPFPPQQSCSPPPRAHQAHPPDQRRHRAVVGRPGTRLSAIRHPRSALGRPGGDHRRARLVHRILSALRLQPRRLRSPVRREARTSARHPRQARHLVGPASAAAQPASIRAPSTAAAGLDRVRRHSALGRARRRSACRWRSRSSAASRRALRRWPTFTATPATAPASPRTS